MRSVLHHQPLYCEALSVVDELYTVNTGGYITRIPNVLARRCLNWYVGHLPSMCIQDSCMHQERRVSYGVHGVYKEFSKLIEKA